MRVDLRLQGLEFGLFPQETLFLVVRQLNLCRQEVRHAFGHLDVHLGQAFFTGLVEADQSCRLVVDLQGNGDAVVERALRVAAAVIPGEDGDLPRLEDLDGIGKMEARARHMVPRRQAGVGQALFPVRNGDGVHVGHGKDDIRRFLG